MRRKIGKDYLNKIAERMKDTGRTRLFHALMIAALLIGISLASSTLAYLVRGTGAVTNVFAAAPAYTLTYHENDGVTPTTVTNMPVPSTGIKSYTGTFDISEAVPKREGYRFDGWNTQADGNGTRVGASTAANKVTYTVPNKNVYTVNLYAQWIQDKYTLIYDANTGSNPPAAQTDETVDATCTFTIADAPLMTHPDGKVFMGWADTANATEAVYGYNGTGYGADGKPTTSLASTVTLTAPDKVKRIYAVWGTRYRLTFYANEAFGGSGDVPQGLDIVTRETSVSYTLPTKEEGPVPRRSLYDFQYWGGNLDWDGSDETSPAIRDNETVRYNYSNSGSTYPETVVLYAAKPELDLFARYRPTQAARLYYNLNAYKADGSVPRVLRNGLPEYETAQVTGTQYKWEHNLRTEVPTRPDETGRYFLGWSRNPDADEPDADLLPNPETGLGALFIMDLDVNYELTLYAVWTKPHKFSVNFHRNGGDEFGFSGDHGFGVGYFHNDGSVASVYDKTNPPDYVTLTSWDFDTDVKQYTLVGGQSQYLYVDCRREGYQLLGWSEEPNATEPTYHVPLTNSYGALNAIGGRITDDFEFACPDAECDGGTTHLCADLYAVWMPIHRFAIEFTSKEEGISYSLGASGFGGDYSGRLVRTPRLQATQTSYTIPAGKIWATAGDGWSKGRKFLGWTSKPNGTTVEYAVNSDNYLVDEITLSKNEHEDPACVETDDSGGVVHTALTLYSVWEYRHRFSMKFNVSGGSTARFGSLHPNPASGGQNPKYTEWLPYSTKSFTVPANSFYATPTRTGYKFLGWTDDPVNHPGPMSKYALDENGCFANEIILTEGSRPCGDDTFSGEDHNLALTAVWEPLHAFQISFDYNGGGWFSKTHPDYSTSNGWDISPTSMRTPYVPVSQTEFEIPAETVQAYLYNRDGYKFLGWSTNKDAKVPDPEFELNSDNYFSKTIKLKDPNTDCEGGNVVHYTTLYGVWKPMHSFRIRYNDNGGSVTENTFNTIPDGGRYTQYSPRWTRTPFLETTQTSYTVPGESIFAYATRNGFRFLGWSRNPGATVPDADLAQDSSWKFLNDIELNVNNTTPNLSDCEGGADDWHVLDLYAVWRKDHTYSIRFEPNLTRSYIKVGNSNERNYALTLKSELIPATQTEYTWEAGTVTAHGNLYNTSNVKVGTFRGWSENPLSADPEYTVDDKGRILQPITVTNPGHTECEGGTDHEVLVLYAIYDTNYKITYHGNGGSPLPDHEVFTDVAPSDGSHEFTLYDYITDPTKKPKKQKFAFMGWGTTQNAINAQYGYQDFSNAAYESQTSSLSNTLELTSPDAITTLYAVWWYEYQLLYNKNADDATGADAPAYGYTALTTENNVFTITNIEPERHGYNFVGWALNPEGEGTIYHAGDKITVHADKTTGQSVQNIYAVWEQVTP